MMDWFEQRAPRERLILVVAGVLVIALIGWVAIWKPLDARAAELTGNVDELADLLVDVRRAASLAAGSAGSPVTGGGAIIDVVHSTASQHGFQLERTSNERNGEVMAVSVRAVPFDNLHTWLTELSMNHGLVVQSVSGISADGGPGLVRGQIRLVRR
jgi:general secretion pathway protein M